MNFLPYCMASITVIVKAIETKLPEVVMIENHHCNFDFTTKVFFSLLTASLILIKFSRPILPDVSNIKNMCRTLSGLSQ